MFYDDVKNEVKRVYTSYHSFDRYYGCRYYFDYKDHILYPVRINYLLEQYIKQIKCKKMNYINFPAGRAVHEKNQVSRLETVLQPGSVMKMVKYF